jgi:Glycosyltransferase family 87
VVRHSSQAILCPQSEDRRIAESFANPGTGHLSSYRGLGNFGSRAFVAALVLTLIALLIYISARRPVDFPVYHYGTRHMLARNGPLYGPKSGIGWPQVYRYPPLFLVLFVPFALLPLRLAALVWAALKFVVLGFLGQALFSKFRTEGFGLQLLSVLPALPYLAVEFHYGNVQFFIFALVAAAFLWLEKQPVLAAAILALAVSLKVWPLFFVPYLLARKRLLVGGLALVLTAGFTLLPAAYFGWHANASLLHQWAKEEFGIAATSGEPAVIGFPSQSLHSVLMRFLTSINYAILTDSNYPKLNFANFDPHAIEFVWVVLAATGYMSLLVLARKTAHSEELTLDSLAFCALLLLQPFTQIDDLVILLWPVVAAVSALYYDEDLPAWVRASLYLALSMMILKPLVPTREAQRFLQVAGIDFAGLCLLTVGLI